MTTHRPGTPDPPDASLDSSETIAVAREELEIGRQTRETGRLRVRKVVREHEEWIDEPVLHEDLEVQRIPVDRVIDGPVPVREDGDLLVVPVVEERLVVQKCLVLVEELHIRRKVSHHRHREPVRLRSEAAVVEHEPAAEPHDGRSDMDR